MMDYQNVKALFPFMNETVYQASEIKVIEKDAPCMRRHLHVTIYFLF